jgi:hypothetical protein
MEELVKSQISYWSEENSDTLKDESLGGTFWGFILISLKLNILLIHLDDSISVFNFISLSLKCLCFLS